MSSNPSFESLWKWGADITLSGSSTTTQLATQINALTAAINALISGKASIQQGVSGFLPLPAARSILRSTAGLSCGYASPRTDPSAFRAAAASAGERWADRVDERPRR